MASRTQIVCLHEGKKGRSIDPIFIRALLKALNPGWIRPHAGNNIIRAVDCGGRTDLIAKTPSELKSCVAMGGDTTLMVWADLDDDMADGDSLKREFEAAVLASGLSKDVFDRVVFVFAKDRLENWIQYLLDGDTNESQEGPRVRHTESVYRAAKVLAERCKAGTAAPELPASLAWSCRNWRQLVARMKSDQ